MKTLTMDSFVKIVWDDEAAGIYHTGDALFALKCSAGRVVFENGHTSVPLPDILALLGNRGIRRLPLEWDGWTGSAAGATENDIRRWAVQHSIFGDGRYLDEATAAFTHARWHAHREPMTREEAEKWVRIMDEPDEPSERTN
jgi:hypothetical protein